MWLSIHGCPAPFHENCPQHHEHKGDPRVTPETCGDIGERGQVILMWVRTPGVENTSHPRRLKVTRIWPWVMNSLWRPNSIMLEKHLNRRCELGDMAIWRTKNTTTMTWEWSPRLPRFEQPYIHQCLLEWGKWRSIDIYAKKMMIEWLHDVIRDHM